MVELGELGGARDADRRPSALRAILAAGFVDRAIRVVADATAGGVGGSGRRRAPSRSAVMQALRRTSAACPRDMRARSYRGTPHHDDLPATGPVEPTSQDPGRSTCWAVRQHRRRRVNSERLARSMEKTMIGHRYQQRRVLGHCRSRSGGYAGMTKPGRPELRSSAPLSPGRPRHCMA